MVTSCKETVHGGNESSSSIIECPENIEKATVSLSVKQ